MSSFQPKDINVLFYDVDTKLQSYNGYWNPNVSRFTGFLPPKVIQSLYQANNTKLLEAVETRRKELLERIDSLGGFEAVLDQIPYLVIHNRLLPQNAEYFLFRWLEHLQKKKVSSHETLETLKIATVCPEDNIEKTLHSKNNKFTPQLQSSYMSSTFTPPPPFPRVNIQVINKIFKEAEEVEITKEETESLQGAYYLLQRLEALCGVSPNHIVRFRQRKRKEGCLHHFETLTAQYQGLLHQDRKKSLHKSLWHWRKYNRALLQTGRLRGRLQLFFSPFITAVCAKLDKSGLATVLSTPQRLSESDIASVLFVALATSQFSTRKAFTLESQQQGGLTPRLQWMFNYLKESPSTDWELVASIYPVQTVFSKLSEEKLYSLLSEWIKVQIPIAKFLKEQWGKGVEGCAQRGMMVPRAGTTSVDSSGWNKLVGSWNNVVRFVRGISNALGEQPPVMLKCMKLLAADQMAMADAFGAEEQVDIRVFVNLANKRITPWDVVLGHCYCSEELIRKACEEEKVPPHRWLGMPQERVTEAKQHGDMICGVYVGNQGANYAILQSLGAFGYKP